MGKSAQQLKIGYLTNDQAKTSRVHVCVTLEPDENNALFAGISSVLESQIKWVENAAMKFATKTRKP